MANPYRIQFKYAKPSAKKPEYYSQLSRLNDTIEFEVHGQSKPLATEIPESVKKYLNDQKIKWAVADDNASGNTDEKRDELPSIDLTRKSLEKILNKLIDTIIDEQIKPHLDIIGVKKITTQYRKIYGKYGQRMYPSDVIKNYRTKDFQINDIISQVNFLKRFVELLTQMNKQGVDLTALQPKISSLREDIQKFIKQKKSDFSWVKPLLIAIPATALFLATFLVAMINPLLINTTLGIVFFMIGMFGGIFAAQLSWMTFANKMFYRSSMTKRATAITDFFKLHPHPNVATVAPTPNQQQHKTTEQSGSPTQKPDNPPTGPTASPAQATH